MTTQIVPHAYKTMSNISAMEISLNDKWSDSLYYRYENYSTSDYEVNEWKEVEIEFHTKSGKPYFRTEFGQKHYLDEFMKL